MSDCVWSLDAKSANKTTMSSKPNSDVLVLTAEKKGATVVVKVDEMTNETVDATRAVMEAVTVAEKSTEMMDEKVAEGLKSDGVSATLQLYEIFLWSVDGCFCGRQVSILMADESRSDLAV